MTRRLTLNRPDQWRALSSKVRVQVVDQLELGGPRSVSEIAAELGLTTHALYHHFRQLEAAGIIRVDHSRRSGAREEAVYDLLGRPVVVRYEPDSKATRALRVKSARRLLRQAERDYAAAVDSAPSNPPPDAPPEIRRHFARLRPGSVRKIQKHLDAIFELMTSERVPAAEADTASRRYAWLTLLSPLDGPEAGD